MLLESEVTPEDIQAREKKLEDIAAQAYPDYIIDAGDIFTVKVYNNPDLEVTTPVTPDGYIAMMFVGQIKVGGLTIPEAVKQVESALSAYIKNPVVGILPQEIRSQTATISGAVSDPGIYSVHGNIKLADMFEVGGSSKRRLMAVLTDTIRKLIFVGAKRLFRLISPKPSTDPLQHPLQKGDYIYIAARTEKMVSVFGEVRTPRFQLWTSGMGLLEAPATPAVA